MRVAVLMLNLGGPRNLSEVRPFLTGLFLDRGTIRLPGGRLGQQVLGRLIARLKAPRSRANYAAIGGGSPLLQWTRDQGSGMAERVERSLADVEVLPLPCMRFWHPRADEALAAAREWGADHVVAFSQYPHYSSATTGSSLDDLRRAADVLDLRIPMTAIESWHVQPTYVQCLAECVRDGVAASEAREPGEVVVLYSAHSLPVNVVERGDPYPDQVKESVAEVHRRSGLDLRRELAWQSKAGPIAWLEPATDARVRALPGEGVRHVVVVPVSFVNDHIETLHELDIELAATARSVGLGFARAPAPNLRPTFLHALAELLVEHIGRVRSGAAERIR